MEKDRDINQYAISFKYQLLSYIRTKRFIALVIFSLAVSILVTVLTFHIEYSLLKKENSAKYMNSYLSPFFIDIVVIVAAFFGGDLISTDTGTNSAYYILVQPVKRYILFMGKYTAALISSFIIVFIYVIVGYIGSFYLYGNLTNLVGKSLLMTLLFIAGTLMLAGFFSSVFKSSTVGIIASILILIIVFPVISTVLGSLEGIDPYFLITSAGSAAYLVFQKPYPAAKVVSHVTPHIKTYTFNPTYYQGIEVALLYLIIFSILAILIYSRRQIEG